MNERTWTHEYPCGHRLLLPVKSGHSCNVPPTKCPLCNGSTSEATR